MLIYLDTCCLNRPYDDQSQPRIRAEASAILDILESVEVGKHRLLASTTLLVEVKLTPDMERQTEILTTLTRLAYLVQTTLPIVQRSKELAALGLKTFDALHLANAEAGEADYLLTTDDRFEKAALRHITSVPVINPLTWLTKHLA